MVEKKIVLMYGEQTVQKSYRIPKSKFEEIDKAIKALLFKYENPKRIVVVCKGSDVKKGEKITIKNIESNSIDYKVTGLSEGPDGSTIANIKVLRPTSEISNSKPIVLKELPKDAVPYQKSTKKFHSAAKDVWYSKCYVDRKWEILEFADFESMEKYFENKLNQIKNG